MDFKKPVKTPLDLALWRKSWVESLMDSVRLGAKRGAGVLDKSSAEALKRSRSLKEARLYFFSEEMSDLTYASSEGMEAVDLLDLLPTKSGVVWMDLKLPAGRSAGQMYVSGLFWGLGDGGKLFVEMVLSHEDFGEIVAIQADGGYTEEDKFRHAKMFGTSPVPVPLLKGDVGDMQDAANGSASGINLRLVQTLVSALSLLQSKNIPEVNERKVGVPAQGKKGKIRKSFKDTVSVVGVRSIQHKEATTKGGKTLTCRFIVGGHFRNQPYKSTGEVKRIFIDPYIKGPADAPLKVNRPVYKL